MSERIDGKALAARRASALKDELEQLKLIQPNPRNPVIVSFCNREDQPSVMYTNMKKAKASEIGIDFLVEEYTVNTSKDDIAEKIASYNSDSKIDGIMVQLPLPQELNIFQDDLLNLIDPKKDVDGLTEKGRKLFMPATVKAVISILEDSVPDWQTKSIGVVGVTGEVGKPLSLALLSRGVNVIGVSRSVGQMEDIVKADIVVSATGSHNLVKPEMIKEGAVLIDVGLGDFDPECFEKASLYTPKFGGVGPITVISLMENAVASYQRVISNRR